MGGPSLRGYRVRREKREKICRRKRCIAGREGKEGGGKGEGWREGGKTVSMGSGGGRYTRWREGKGKGCVRKGGGVSGKERAWGNVVEGEKNSRSENREKLWRKWRRRKKEWREGRRLGEGEKRGGGKKRIGGCAETREARVGIKKR